MQKNYIMTITTVQQQKYIKFKNMNIQNFKIHLTSILCQLGLSDDPQFS